MFILNRRRRFHFRAWVTTGFVLLLSMLLTVNAYAQGSSLQEERQNKLEDIIKNSAQAPGPDKLIVDPARPKPLPGSSSDPKTRSLYEKALQDYYSYRSDGLQHRRAVFKWQLFSAKLIFFIVLTLVASGVVFAAIQFRAGLQQEKMNNKKLDMSTEMEISAKGVKVNSPVIGVIILTISLAFFYLYLVYVYPIENIF